MFRRFILLQAQWRYFRKLRNLGNPKQCWHLMKIKGPCGKICLPPMLGAFTPWRISRAVFGGDRRITDWDLRFVSKLLYWDFGRVSNGRTAFFIVRFSGSSQCSLIRVLLSTAYYYCLQYQLIRDTEQIKYYTITLRPFQTKANDIRHSMHIKVLG